jgi:glycosyltransferase 2 family protein
VIAHLARSFWVRALLTVGILTYLATRIDMREAGAAMLRLDWRAALVVLVLLIADRAVMIWRWVLLLRASDVPVSGRSAVRIHLVSSFIGGFLPAGVGGDALRAWSLSRRTGEGSEAIASVTIDRLIGMVSIVLLGSIGALVWARHLEPGLRHAAMVAGLLGLGGTAVVLWADRAVRFAWPGSGPVSGRAGKILDVVDAIARYRRRHAVLFAVLGLSMAVQVLRVLEAYVLGVGIGLTVPFTYYLVFMPIGLLMLLLPVSISGFGLPQGVIVWLLRPVGVPDAASFALSTLIVLTGIAGNLPGALLYLGRRNP